MAVNYQRMHATTTRLLTQNGSTWKITRPGKLVVIGGMEHNEPDVRFDAVGIRTDYQPSEIDGTIIQNGDMRIVFTADTELKTGDLVDVDGVMYRIRKPNPVKPATLLLCYRAQLRA